MLVGAHNAETQAAGSSDRPARCRRCLPRLTRTLRATDATQIPEANPVNQEARKQAIDKLEELRAQVATRLGDQHQPLTTHVDEIRSLVEQDTSATGAPAQPASAAAARLEQRLLAWEAEHPQLAALAARIARALEDAGL